MESAKHFIDGASIAAMLAALAGWLPVVAAVASLIWTCIRIYETRTVQGLLAKRRNRRRTDAKK